MAHNPQDYTELGRKAILNGLCWNVPAISHGRIYARSTTQAVALDVSLPPPPPLELDVALVNAGTLGLRIRSAAGALLDSNRASRIHVMASSSLATNASSSWVKLTNALVLTDGQLVASDPISPESTQRLYQAREPLSPVAVFRSTLSSWEGGFALVFKDQAMDCRGVGRRRLAPEFRSIYLTYDAAVDWSPDDPRLQALADRSKRWMANRYDRSKRSKTPVLDPTVVELIAITFGGVSPAWDRLAELARQH